MLVQLDFSGPIFEGFKFVGFHIPGEGEYIIYKEAGDADLNSSAEVLFKNDNFDMPVTDMPMICFCKVSTIANLQPGARFKTEDEDSYTYRLLADNPSNLSEHTCYCEQDFTFDVVSSNLEVYVL